MTPAECGLIPQHLCHGLLLGSASGSVQKHLVVAGVGPWAPASPQASCPPLSHPTVAVEAFGVPQRSARAGRLQMGPLGGSQCCSFSCLRRQGPGARIPHWAAWDGAGEPWEQAERLACPEPRSELVPSRRSVTVCLAAGGLLGNFYGIRGLCSFAGGWAHRPLHQARLSRPPQGAPVPVQMPDAGWGPGGGKGAARLPTGSIRLP